MPVETPDDSPARDEIARRATRRWRLSMGLTALVVVVSVSATGVLSRPRPQPAHHHHLSLWAAIAVLVVALLLLAAAVSVLVRAFRRPRGFFAPPITAGLPRRQRRAVSRALRHGLPSEDPVLALVERESADRIVRYFRWTVIVFVLAAAGSAAALFGRPSAFIAAVDIAACAMSLLLLTYACWLTPRARRYLATADRHATSGTRSD